MAASYRWIGHRDRVPRSALHGEATKSDPTGKRCGFIAGSTHGARQLRGVRIGMSTTWRHRPRQLPSIDGRGQLLGVRPSYAGGGRVLDRERRGTKGETLCRVVSLGLSAGS